MAKLNLSYPGLNFGGSLRGLMGRLGKGSAGMKYPLLATHGGRRRGRRGGRNPELSDALAIENAVLNREKFEYQKGKDKYDAAVGLEKHELELRKEDRMERRFEFDQLKEGADQLKSLVNKWTELEQQAKADGDTARVRNIHDQMKDFHSHLSPIARQVVDPILKAGPFDPRKEKVRRWEQTNPAPQVTAKFDEDPQAWAIQQTDVLNWRADRTGIATGKRPEVKKLTGVGEGLYLFTPNGGELVTEEMLNLKSFAKKGNTTELDVIAQGGYYTKPRSVFIDGREHMVANKVGIDGAITTETVSQKPHPKKDKMNDFLADFAVWDDLDDDEKENRKEGIVGTVKMMMEELKMGMPEISATYLKPKYGQNFILTKRRIPGLIWDGERDVLKAVPGDFKEIWNGYFGFYDALTDRVFSDQTGEFVGNLDETISAFRRAHAKSKTQAKGSF